MTAPGLYIPKRDANEIKNDFQMARIIELLNKHKVILQLSAAGETTIEIGKKVFKSSRTVEVYIDTMVKETGSKNKTNLIYNAMKLKIIE